MESLTGCEILMFVRPIIQFRERTLVGGSVFLQVSFSVFPLSVRASD